jgi:hypothetical protein
MQGFVDGAVVAFLALVSLCLTKFWGVVTEKLPFWNKLSDRGREYGGYVIILVNAGLFWLLQVNAVPGLGPVAGRVLSCIAAAFGPSALFDIFLDRPAQPVTLVTTDPADGKETPVVVLGVVAAKPDGE